MASSKKDQLLLRLTEELGTNIVELDNYVNQLILLPGLGVNKAHVEHLQMIREKATRLKQIQHALLNIEKIERGEFTLAKNDNSLRGIIIDTVSSLQFAMDSRKVKIRIDILHDVKCNCDKNKIETVLNNLLTNSIDFSPPNSEIVVSLNVEGKNGIIEIKDKGVGVQESEVKNIFNADYQMDLSVKRDHIESGLALPVCKTIIEEHNGKIWLESKGADMGTTTHILLPLYVDERLRKFH